jgi:hypothetical protein
MPPKLLLKTLGELGLLSLWSSPFDTKLLCYQLFVRLFAYGSSTLILVSYLSALQISKLKIGLFMRLTLIGDTVLSFVLRIFADSVGRKVILSLGQGWGLLLGRCLLFAGIIGSCLLWLWLGY